MYLEEMRREPTEADQKPLEPVTPVTALPKTVETLLGADDPLTGRLRMYPSPTGTFEPFMALFNTTAAAIGLNPDATELTEDALTKLVKRVRLPVVQYDIRTDPPKIFAKKILRDLNIGYAIFVVGGAQGPAMLVTSTEAPALLNLNELPTAFKEYVDKRVKDTWVVRI